MKSNWDYLSFLKIHIVLLCLHSFGVQNNIVSFNRVLYDVITRLTPSLLHPPECKAFGTDDLLSYLSYICISFF